MEIMQRAEKNRGAERRDYAMKLNLIVDSMNREKREYDKKLHSFYEKYCNVTPKMWTKKEKPSLKRKLSGSIRHPIPRINKNTQV